MNQSKVSVNFGFEFFKDEEVEAFILRAPNGQVYSVASDFAQFDENLCNLVAELEQAYEDRKSSSGVVEHI